MCSSIRKITVSAIFIIMSFLLFALFHINSFHSNIQESAYRDGYGDALEYGYNIGYAVATELGYNVGSEDNYQTDLEHELVYKEEYEKVYQESLDGVLYAKKIHDSLYEYEFIENIYKKEYRKGYMDGYATGHIKGYEKEYINAYYAGFSKGKDVFKGSVNTEAKVYKIEYQDIFVKGYRAGYADAEAEEASEENYYNDHISSEDIASCIEMGGTKALCTD